MRNTTTGGGNCAFGAFALLTNTTGSWNVADGTQAMYLHTSGDNNTVIGGEAGTNNITGSGNVFLGYKAGYNEAGSDKLYIANSETSTPLIGGNFSTKKVIINDVLQMTPRASAPSSPANGELYVNSTDNHIYCYLGGIWKQLD